MTFEQSPGERAAIRAPRGTRLSARSWQTEAPLRMLMNNLDPDVAERRPSGLRWDWPSGSKLALLCPDRRNPEGTGYR